MYIIREALHDIQPLPWNDLTLIAACVPAPQPPFLLQAAHGAQPHEVPVTPHIPCRVHTHVAGGHKADANSGSTARRCPMRPIRCGWRRSSGTGSLRRLRSCPRIFNADSLGVIIAEPIGSGQRLLYHLSTLLSLLIIRNLIARQCDFTSIPLALPSLIFRRGHRRPITLAVSLLTLPTTTRFGLEQ